MGTNLSPELSKRNKYYIPKYRYLELKYFCLQYPMWLKEYAEILHSVNGTTMPSESIKTNSQVEFIDKTSDTAIKLAILNAKISLVRKIGKMSDPDIGDWVLKGVTEGLSFSYLKGVCELPCERDMYYDRYRRFFWLISGERG